MTPTSLPVLIVLEICVIPCIPGWTQEAPVLIWPLHRDVGTLELIYQTFGKMGDEIYLHEGAGPFTFQKPYMLYGTDDSYFELTVPEFTSLDHDVSFRCYVFPLTDSGAIFHYTATTETFDLVTYLSSGSLSFILRVGLYYILLPSQTEIPKYQWSLLTVVYRHNKILVNINELEDVDKVSIPFHAGHIRTPGVLTIGKGDIAGTATSLPHFFGSFTCLQIILGDESFLDPSYDDYCSGHGLGNTTSTTSTTTALTTTTNKHTTTSSTTPTTITTTTNKPMTTTLTTTTTSSSTASTTTTYIPPTTSTTTTTTTTTSPPTSTTLTTGAETTTSTLSTTTTNKPSTTTIFTTSFTTTPTTNKPTTTLSTTSTSTSTTTAAATSSSSSQTMSTTTVLTPYTSSLVTSNSPTSAEIPRTTVSQGTSYPTKMTSVLSSKSSTRHTPANTHVTASRASVSTAATVSIIASSVANSSPVKSNLTALTNSVPLSRSSTITSRFNLTSQKSTDISSASTSQPTPVTQETADYLHSNGTENSPKLVPGIYITESDYTVTPSCKKFRKYSDGVTITSSDTLHVKVAEDVRSCVQLCSSHIDCGMFAYRKEDNGNYKCKTGRTNASVESDYSYTMFVVG